ncbi:MAG: VWA domain-containing protein [Verrucomicrobiaceae bacterium]|nr:VWA domain-containing protein [Verrucomicrobiaceae bacterium]
MLNFLVNPGLFIAGLIAIASPIIIHLLNRRRFKRIDWAAMDFLMEAQRLNRRRVKLEEFILLLLRCLAMGLIGLLLARPFLDVNPESFFRAGATERVIVLDDSLSMAARSGDKTPIEEASSMLRAWVEALVRDNKDDFITVVRTTDPDHPAPWANGLPLTEATMGGLLDEIDGLEARDSAGKLNAALLHVEESFKDDKASLQRVVYLLTDLRRRDWEVGAGGESDAGVVSTLGRISEAAAGCYVIDLGESGEENLVVEKIVPLDKAIIAGVPAEFEVVVRNRGVREANDVGLKFVAGDMLPVEARIDRIGPGDTGVAAFTYTFASAIDGESEAKEVSPVPVEVRLDNVAASSGDLLEEDNIRYFPARVVRGIRVLLVDGDPSGNYGQSETFYLKNALAPDGPSSSGVEVTVVDDSEFDDVELSEFEVIVIANLYRVTEGRAATMENWVRDGGGLVFLLGDQADEDVYNDILYKEGKGLLPVRLSGIEGDEKEEAWTLLSPDLLNHPVFRFFDGDNRQLLDGVKVFRWWHCEAPAPDPTAAELSSAGVARVIASFNNESRSPAFVEKRLGEGQVMVVMSPLDNDWSNFPENGATFLITSQEMIRYMARNRTEEGVISVAQPISQKVDLREFSQNVEILPPGNTEPQSAEARPDDSGPENGLIWNVNFEETGKRGMYELKLMRAAGGEFKTMLFAANIDTGESDLSRASEDAIRGDLGDAQIEFVGRGESVIELEGAVGRSEIWKMVLYVLIALLAVELLFGWWIGARR